MQNQPYIPVYETRFESISDFTWSVTSGAEINFIWKNKMYVIIGCDARGIAFSEGCCLKDDKYYNVVSHTEYNIEDELIFDTVDALLDLMLEGDRLRDIITQVRVTDRTV